MKYFFTTLIVILNFSCAYSQDTSIILGKSEKVNSAAIYDLSDPTGLNIEVDLWGIVRLPGRYRVPINTTFIDLLSFSGGPIEFTKLEDMRIIRTDSYGKTTIINLNYGDLLWEDKIKPDKRINPILQAGDVVVIPEERRYTFRENLQFYLPIVTGLLSIAVFIITVSRKN
jgi:hypothetical protein